MLNAFRPKAGTAADALAVGAFLMLWLTIWPFWLIFKRYFPARAFSSPGQTFL